MAKDPGQAYQNRGNKKHLKFLAICANFTFKHYLILRLFAIKNNYNYIMYTTVTHWPRKVRSTFVTKTYFKGS